MAPSALAPLAAGGLAESPAKLGERSAIEDLRRRKSISRSTSPGSSLVGKADTDAGSPFVTDSSPANSPFVTDASPASNPLRIGELGRPASLESFLHERLAQSCPASRGVSFDEVGSSLGSWNLFENTETSQSATQNRGLIDWSLPDEGKQPLRVRNTFIDEHIGRPLSLEGFMQERVARSCPVSREASLDEQLPPGLESVLASIGEFEPNFPVTREASLEDFMHPAGLECFLASIEATQFGTPLQWPAVPSVGCLGMPPGLEPLLAGQNGGDVLHSMVPPLPRTEVQKPMAPAPRAPPPPPTHFAPVMSRAEPPPAPQAPPPPPTHFAPVMSRAEPPPPPPAAAPGVSELQLADVIDEPELGSAALPTVGSMNHRFGTCNPCAFVHTKGCGNGVDCPFCHLCAPGERRARKKERKIHRIAQQRMMESQKLVQAATNAQPLMHPR